MASVQLDREDLGSLAPVCVITGQPAEMVQVWEFAWVPRSRWRRNMLLLLPELAIWQARVDRVAVQIELPVTERGLRRVQRIRLIARWLWLGATIVLLAGAVARAVLPLAVGFGGLVVGLLVEVYKGSVTPSMVEGNDAGTVRLAGVAPEFVGRVKELRTAAGEG